jgi:NitT/TauT family transport system substrate-binding protein
MSCCTALAPDPAPRDANAPPATGPASRLGPRPISRRSALKGIAGTIAGLALGGLGGVALGQGGRRVRLAFCSQLLCVVPYEFTRARGLFAAEGLDVELVYTRGGNAAMQALVGGAVEYAATSFDVALLAYANGAPIRRFATTGRLPLFALATSPARAGDLLDVTDLAGATVGVSALGNADHVLALYLLANAGVDAASVSFAALGVNMFEAIRRNQVHAGMVQEPALSLLAGEGAGVLFNAMDLADAERVLGGAYEFMGVAVRADELDERLEEMRALSRALEAGLIALQTAPVEELVAALPPELIAGDDEALLWGILSRTRRSLYPDTVTIDVDSSRRVEESQRIAGIREEPVDLDALLARHVLEAPVR